MSMEGLPFGAQADAEIRPLVMSMQGQPNTRENRDRLHFAIRGVLAKYGIDNVTGVRVSGAGDVLGVEVWPLTTEQLDARRKADEAREAYERATNE